MMLLSANAKTEVYKDGGISYNNKANQRFQTLTKHNIEKSGREIEKIDASQQFGASGKST